MPDRLPHQALDQIRRTRRHPAPTQPDYLHLKYLVTHIRQALGTDIGPAPDVLDVFCGTRPYEDLLPAGARVTGLDIDDTYGAADVVSQEFLPFEDHSFDLVVCFEGFHYVADPVAAVAEIRRVLRPGGTTLITVPLVWEYDRTILERRFTGPELVDLFDGWSDPLLVENGGRAASWALLTGSVLNLARARLARGTSRPNPLGGVFGAGFLAINAVAVQADRAERAAGSGPRTLPPNLLLRARLPADG